jgi:hypothetical protein
MTVGLGRTRNANQILGRTDDGRTKSNGDTAVNTYNLTILQLIFIGAV